MDDTHYREAICPACGIIDRFGDKWSLRILFLLHQKGTFKKHSECVTKDACYSIKKIRSR